ncbi:hypothetical protein HDV06_003970 [Boothiomyces sp. JEL0866]|nr:hypothetical protein HDV06_003970 [Boothiomyces sp. JEL0866]
MFGFIDSAFESACLSFLQKFKIGFVEIRTSDQIIEVGDFTSKTRAVMTVINPAFWQRVVFNGVLGFGEGFMNGEIEVDDLATLLLICIKNREKVKEMNVLPFGMNKMINTALNSNIPNTIYNALFNIQAHYDLGNELFAAFLDPTMTYSCPIWKDENDNDLEGAQYRKIHSLLKNAEIRKGMKVLEIGTGWGALAIEAVKLYDCSVVTLTLSEEQKLLAEERIAAAGYSDRITVLLCDYRNLDPSVYQFDRIVTCEMLEAVGPEFLPLFFECADTLLGPNGVVSLQVITMPDSRYENYCTSVDFIKKHIFPGGHCPSVTSLVDAVYAGSKGRLIVDKLDNIGPHYAKCLRLWREKFMANFDQVVKETGKSHIYTSEFKRKWEFYFAYCEVANEKKVNYDGTAIVARAENYDNSKKKYNAVVINDPEKRKGTKVFSYDRVFNMDDTQEQIFTEIQPIIEKCMEGFNGCIFAYGQTGSGKTYTMQGLDLTSERGVMPRVIEQITAAITEGEKKGIEYNVTGSYLEIYQEQLRDLLVADEEQVDLRIRIDPFSATGKGLYVEGLVEKHLRSPADYYQIIKKGTQNRTIAETNMNKVSSRSHGVFSLTIDQTCRPLSSSSGLNINKKRSKIHLIDLAGSERVESTGATGTRLKEGSSINMSLSSLGNVINALSSGNTHIPYRDSKLTYLLSDSLGGNSITLILACITPLAISYDETIGTLKFAERAKKVQNNAIINLDPQSRKITELENEILRLKALLAQCNCKNTHDKLFYNFNRNSEPRKWWEKLLCWARTEDAYASQNAYESQTTIVVENEAAISTYQSSVYASEVSSTRCSTPFMTRTTSSLKLGKKSKKIGQVVPFR